MRKSDIQTSENVTYKTREFENDLNPKTENMNEENKKEKEKVEENATE